MSLQQTAVLASVDKAEPGQALRMKQFMDTRYCNVEAFAELHCSKQTSKMSDHHGCIDSKGRTSSSYMCSRGPPGSLQAPHPAPVTCMAPARLLRV